MEERQDLISRQVAIDALRDAENHAFNSFYKGLAKAHKIIADLPSVQPDHVADIGKKVEGDCISRQAAIDALARMMPRSYTPDGSHPADEEIFRAQEVFADCIEALEILSPAQPDNQTNLCDSCDCSYPDCPSKYDDVIFGNGIGNDNICACNKYKPSAQPEQRWIPCSERLPYAEYGESDNVLATCGHRDVEDGSIRWIKMLYFNGGNWCCPTGEAYLEKVYAWMPLPEPYRGGEK